ncbi:RNase H2 suC domain containing protein [Asbolus verrucosus]|uniref:RNase H2 suC domain containing protein n=1 Tax=Asbolus verrucosus TaxID=1661398 RepID=A0A482WA29_ASBVE|nr:RNase H2 suC domain containing protein [Asbolus verrucosus]
MAIHILHGKSYILLIPKETKIHSVPFKIHADCDAKVSKYFESSIKVEEDKTMKASFRGYPLRGETIELPQGYVGIVLHERILPPSEKERKFHVIHNFKSLNYWNWDKAPTKNDKIVQAFEWIDVAEAVSSY